MRWRFSARSCTTAQGLLPVAGSVMPTGLSAPKRSASWPVRATSSTGWQAWKSSRRSKSRKMAFWAPTSSVMKASYSSLFMGQLR